MKRDDSVNYKERLETLKVCETCEVHTETISLVSVQGHKLREFHYHGNFPVRKFLIKKSYCTWTQKRSHRFR